MLDLQNSSLPWRVVPLTEANCQELCTWKYPPPYELYNWPSWENMLQNQTEFADPEIRAAQYRAVIDKDEELSGFVQYFPITGVTRLGLGLRPDLCGRGGGIGTQFVQLLTREALRNAPDNEIDLEVLIWNERAIRTYEKAGFIIKDTCGNCSSCKDDRDTVDITVEAQKIFSCIRRMNERFGISMVASVLKGSKAKKILDYRFDSLPTHGIMRELPEKEIAELINVLISEGFLQLSDGQYPVVKLMQPAAEVLQGKLQVNQKVRKQPVRAVAAIDNTLFEQLRLLRREIAAREKVPPYIIFADSTLREMSEICPTSESAMLRIKGVGEVKYRNYGKPFLDLLRTYAGESEVEAVAYDFE